MSTEYPTYGWVTATEALAAWGGCRVWIDEEEVTDDCFEANDRAGWVRLFIRGRDDQGNRLRWIETDTMTGKPKEETRYGRVRIVPNRPPAP